MRLLTFLVTVMLVATPAAGQSSAEARATIDIGEVLSLDVRPGGGIAATTDGGAYRELPGAVELLVTANRPWELHVVLDGQPDRVAGVEGAGSAEPAIWWRAESEEAETGGEYRRAERRPVLVASGSGGRTKIALDYRWLDASGRELEPGTILHFMLSGG